MMIRKMALPRRAFLRGVGVTLALPWLEAMIPALTPHAKAAQPVTRFGFVYVPNGMIVERWIPKTVGENFEFNSSMKPLEPLRQHLTVITNMLGRPDSGPHTGASGPWLNGCSLKRNDADQVAAGTSIDQMMAKALGQETMIPSMELATEDLTSLVGVCDTGFSCVYINTLSWATPTTPLPMEINPRVVFERMFGDAKTKEQRMARMREDNSILDSISEDASRLRTSLGTTDRLRVTDYLDNVREIERRIQAAEKQADLLLTVPDRPAGVPDSYDDHVALMFDLMTVAYQANITRVLTFMMARELSGRTYPQLAAPDPHHAISHHQDNPAQMDKQARINEHHAKLFAGFLERLKNAPDGDGSLLDHSMIVYGAGLGEGNVHEKARLSFVVAGGLNGTLKSNRHIKAADDTPSANALAAFVRKAGIEVDKIGEGTGVMEL